MQSRSPSGQAVPSDRPARPWRVAKYSVTLVIAALLASCGSAGQAVKTAAIVTGNDSSLTAHLLLVSSSTAANGGFNFDGYGNGAMRITIPLGWLVDVTCKNASSLLSHSCAVIEDRPLSPYGAPLAFPGSSTPDPKTGLLPGDSSNFSFRATKVGTYRISCLVSGHEIDGMWDWLDVIRGGLPTVKTPS
ncbi:MAG: sulfocyanin-like copper-binding protein [Acidimicrobiales bacterium]